ncbi:Ppx/GppA phosphatase family protein [Thiovibrio sp. JS02]
MRQRQSMTTAAGIDLGTNSFRLLIAQITGKGLMPLHKALVTVRLGEGLGKTGMLSRAACLRGEETLAVFAGTLAEHAPLSLRACGTHALRRAKNQEEFLARAAEILGQAVEVISGGEEAALSLDGVASAMGELARYPLFLSDVGGGSSELIWQESPGARPLAVSLPLGAVALTEEFGDDLPAMGAGIREALQEGLKNFPAAALAGCPSFLGCGGTATSLAALALVLDKYDARLVQNYALPLSRLEALAKSLASLPPKERNALPGLAQGRGEIIMAGTLICQELMRLLKSRELMVSDAGLLEGILLSGLARAGPLSGF